MNTSALSGSLAVHFEPRIAAVLFLGDYKFVLRVRSREIRVYGVHQRGYAQLVKSAAAEYGNDIAERDAPL